MHNQHHKSLFAVFVLGALRYSCNALVIVAMLSYRQASDLTEKATPSQSRAIREPLADVNRRWDDLNKAINNRQKELEQALLRLGQFQHALNELLIWIERTGECFLH